MTIVIPCFEAEDWVCMANGMQGPTWLNIAGQLKDVSKWKGIPRGTVALMVMQNPVPDMPMQLQHRNDKLLHCKDNMCSQPACNSLRGGAGQQ